MLIEFIASRRTFLSDKYTGYSGEKFIYHSPRDGTNSDRHRSYQQKTHENS